ncbi:hypothetical protein EVAR_11748_1 [Eumeta japonica]|uniref:Uncharacterized protein n=1 Tax=Eumeta variegata TaxID=151549 RepID=A0A4C1UPN3_EUMVA|nr:hypothetical protein EVAR_11748_1 [Eumeta japonica]
MYVRASLPNDCAESDNAFFVILLFLGSVVKLFWGKKLESKGDIESAVRQCFASKPPNAEYLRKTIEYKELHFEP